MYKVMLVDDEVIIREGLKTRIDWATYGFELAGDYANGLEAQAAIVNNPPDLIISDICMPFVDGLELAEFVHEHYTDTKMILLTGFDEFEYARRAIRLKVSDFILKPITAKEIRSLLQQIKLEMDDQRRLHDNMDQWQDQWSQSLPLLKERFWDTLLTTGIDYQAWEQHRIQFALPPLASPYQIAVIEPDSNHTIEQATSPSLQHVLQLDHYLSTVLPTLLPATFVFASCIYQSRCVYVFASTSVDQSSISTMSAQLDTVFQQLHAFDNQQLNISFTTGLGTGCSDMLDIPQQYQQALQALDYRFLFGTGTLLSFSDLQQSVSPSTSLIDWEKDIVAQLSNNNLLEAQHLSKQMAQQMIRQRISPTECREQFRQVAIRIQHWLAQLGLESAWSDLIRQSPWSKASTLEQMLQQWNTALSTAFTFLNTQTQIHSQQPIQKAIYYIEQHYAEPHLSLQEICSHVLMSTSSFSQAFKQYTELTYVEYLTHVRIDKAKEWLRLTEYKFYQIAEKVGYTDPNYFSSSFKKHTGITPKQYREQHRQVKELSP